jgi:adenine-specific DNA-methyltransferase
MTDAERRLWWHLRELKLDAGHFRRQATIGPYFTDFACHEAKLVVEVDGSGHMQSDVLARDDERTQYLESQGYRVLRFWNTDVLANTEGVMTIIAQALANGIEDPAPHPLPLPTTRKRARGEGKERRED